MSIKQPFWCTGNNWHWLMLWSHLPTSCSDCINSFLPPVHISIEIDAFFICYLLPSANHKNLSLQLVLMYKLESHTLLPQCYWKWLNNFQIVFECFYVYIPNHANTTFGWSWPPKLWSFYEINYNWNKSWIKIVHENNVHHILIFYMLRCWKSGSFSKNTQF